MRTFFLFFALLGIATHMTPGRAQGFSDWHWSFDQATYVAGPSDSITLTATIYVDADSPGPLVGPMHVSFNGTLFSFYDMDSNWSLSFTEANIAPGDSLQFTFGVLTPKFPLAEGSYQNFPDQPLIESLSLATRRIPDSPLVIQVIPEPSILALAGWSAVALVIVRYRRRKLGRP
jgi:hypothetical protein